MKLNIICLIFTLLSYQIIANGSDLTIENFDDACVTCDDHSGVISEETQSVQDDLGGVVAQDSQAQEDIEDDIPYEEITGNLTVVSPVPEDVLYGSSVMVHLNVNTNTRNITRFKEKFNESNICISVDNSVFSCWPIFTLSKYPVFGNMEPGEHFLIAKLVDPETGTHLLESSVATSGFVLLPKNDTDEENQPEETPENPEDLENPSNETGKQQTESIAIPQVGIEYPPENGAVPATFETRLHILTSSNLTRFRRLFEESYLCLSIDPHSTHSCWPIFEERYYPKFFDIPLGKHTMTASISHPNTLESIPGTSLGLRTFWVHDVNAGMIPMNLQDPSPGSHAFTEELRRQVEEESNEKIHANTVLEAQKGTRENVEIESIAFQVGVSGERLTVRVFENENIHQRATEFCQAHKIAQQDCVEKISTLIEKEWQHFRDVKPLELF